MGGLRKVQFFDGHSSSTQPTIADLIDSLTNFADDAAYVTAKGSAAAKGDIYFNTTIDSIRFYSTEWLTVADLTTAQTFSNKTLTTPTVTTPDINGGSFDGQTASSSNFIKIPSNTKANLTALTRVAGLIYYATDEKLYYGDDGADLISIGSGGGGNNTIDVEETTHGRTVLTPLYDGGSSWENAQANDDDTNATHLIVEVPDADNFVLAQFGRYTITAHGLTVKTWYYVDTETAGALTSTRPISGYDHPAVYVYDANTIDVYVGNRPSAIGDGIVSDSEVGVEVDYGGASLPTGYIWKNGPLLSKTTYAILYSKYGPNRHGTDTATHFYAPFDTSLKQYDLTVTGTNWTTATALGVPYVDSEGKWRFRFNVYGTISPTANSFTGTISGVTFGVQSLALTGTLVETAVANRTVQACNANASSSTFTITSEGGAAFNEIRVSGDVPLASKPTFVDDNNPSDYKINKIIRYAPKGALNGVVAPSYQQTQLTSTETLTTAFSAHDLLSITVANGQGGVYVITGKASCGFESNTDIQIKTRIVINGTEEAGLGTRYIHNNGAANQARSSLHFYKIVTLFEGDVVKLQAKTETGWVGKVYATDSSDQDETTLILQRLGDA